MAQQHETVQECRNTWRKGDGVSVTSKRKRENITQNAATQRWKESNQSRLMNAVLFSSIFLPNVLGIPANFSPLNKNQCRKQPSHGKTKINTETSLIP